MAVTFERNKPKRQITPHGAIQMKKHRTAGYESAMQNTTCQNTFQMPEIPGSYKRQNAHKKKMNNVLNK